MPVFNRKTLRRDFGRDLLRDTVVGNTALSLGAAATLALMDSRLANAAFSGNGKDQGAWLWLTGSEYRTATFNAPSGAYVTLQTHPYAVASGSEFEAHRRVSPSEKNRFLDKAIQRVWTRQEYPLAPVAGLINYLIPDAVGEVFDAWIYNSPAGSLDRQRQRVPVGWRVSMTGSGREIQLPQYSSLVGSQQLILDAQVHATLGAGEEATVWLPDEGWVLSGAAMWCYEALAREAPGQDVGKYREESTRFRRSWIAGQAKHLPQITRKLGFGEFI